jgi:hypothetical protein
VSVSCEGDAWSGRTLLHLVPISLAHAQVGECLRACSSVSLMSWLLLLDVLLERHGCGTIARPQIIGS